MTIAPAILEHYPRLNAVQREIVGHLEGPLLVIAGPGFGKTYSIVLRALNLLLLCNRILTDHRHRTELGHGYDTLDELTQLLFIFEHFDEIVGAAENDLFLRRWKTRWTAIEGARAYFDKITEELVDAGRLSASGDRFLEAVGGAYGRYERALLEANRTDFAHLQRLVFDLLPDATTADTVTRDLRYVLVDEYQDTNYIQEQLRLLLYWTSEPRKDHALMVLPYDPARVEEAGRHFDETVRRIQAHEFAVTSPPEAAICKECDLKMLCHAEGIIHREETIA